MAAFSVGEADDEVQTTPRNRAGEPERGLSPLAVQHQSLVTALSERFAEIGGIELDLPTRSEMPRAADFTEHI